MADIKRGQSSVEPYAKPTGDTASTTDIATSLRGIPLKNPVMPASGVFGFGLEYTDFYDPNILGAVVLKGTTREPRFGNPLPRVAECGAGMLNSVGLQNPGIDAVKNIELPRLREIYNGVVIANISGFSVEEYVRCCTEICTYSRADSHNGSPGFDRSARSEKPPTEKPPVDIVEVNISCPNVHNGGMSFGADAKAAAAVTKAVKSGLSEIGVKTPVFVKLSPNVTDIVSIAKACEEAGADGLTLINTLLGARIDLKTRKPILANVSGGYSGRGIFPIALRMVYDCARAVNIPIIGAGGIARAEDVIEMMLAGASAVQIGAENLVNPLCMKEIIADLPRTAAKYGIRGLSDIIGAAIV